MTPQEVLPKDASGTASRPPPTLSKRAKESLKNTSPAAEAMLAKVFGDQVGLLSVILIEAAFLNLRYRCSTLLTIQMDYAMLESLKMLE
jgi:hypothetical protein